ncbi:MAG: Ig-like domain-containing protein, partial [Pseudomonadota bacterium]
MQTILQTMDYEHINPIGTPLPRTFAASVFDVDGASSTPVVSTINAGPGNGPPTADLNGPAGGIDYADTFTEGDAAPSIVDAGVVVSDPEDAISTVTIQVAFGSDSIDRLYVDGAAIAPTISQIGTTFTTASPLSFIYDDVARQLTITDVGGSGVAMTVAQVQEILQLIRFESIGFNPPAGDRTFDIVVTDMAGQSSPVAASTITVVPINDLPVAAPLGGTVDEDAFITYNVAAAATDPDGTINPALTQIVGTASPGDSLITPGEGVWTVNTVAGQIRFTPDPDYDGVVTPIQYVVGDDLGALSAPQTIAPTITPINDAPVAANLGLSLPQGSSFILNVVGNTTDLDGTPDRTTIQISGTATFGDSLTVPGEGVWSVDTVAGTIEFTPEPLFTGQATQITFTINDDSGQPSNVATGDVEVQPVANTAPTLDLSVSGSTTSVSWSHNLDDNRLQPEIVDPVRVASASDLIVGTGLTGTTPTSFFEFADAGFAGTTLANAIAQDDFVEYSFVAGETGLLEAVGYSSFSDSGSYQFAVEISENGFVTSTNLVNDYQHVSASAGDFTVDIGGGNYLASRTIDVADYSLVAGNSYTLRVYFYDAVLDGFYDPGEGLFDDFNLRISASSVDNGSAYFPFGLGVTTAPANLVDPGAGIIDGEDNIVSVSIAASGIVDLGNEQIAFDGTAFTFDSDQTFLGLVFGGTTFDINYEFANQTFTVTNGVVAGGPMPLVDLNGLLRTVVYEDYSPAPTAGLRDFTITATDAGGLVSNAAVATISLQLPELPAALATPFADTLTGTTGSDTIHAQDGDDTIDGAAGIDFLFGQDGADILNGGEGNDVLTGDRVSVSADIVGAEMILNSVRPGNQSAPVVVSLENGNVLVIWYNDADSPNPGSLSTQEFA